MFLLKKIIFVSTDYIFIENVIFIMKYTYIFIKQMPTYIFSLYLIETGSEL